VKSIGSGSRQLRLITADATGITQFTFRRITVHLSAHRIPKIMRQSAGRITNFDCGLGWSVVIPSEVEESPLQAVRHW